VNVKRKYKAAEGETTPTHLYSVDVDVEVRGKVRTYRLVPNTVVSVRKRPALARGQYVFQYAELANGELLIYVDQYGKRRTIRESDITAVAGQ
jgi:hypothetical protein